MSAKAITEGVSNSNWLVETEGDGGGNDGGRFILTMYERRIDKADLPFFLSLLDHLAAKGCPVPPTVHTRSGGVYHMTGGKAVALIRHLPGISVELPSAGQARSVGRTLAQMHLAAADFPLRRQQALGLAAWRELLEQCGEQELAHMDADLPAIALAELDYLEQRWLADLPQGVIHSDLFPDNVLLTGEEVTGLIDFYFAANDALAYDLAVTHAAWCFADEGTAFRPDISDALLSGYQEGRPLTPAERQALPTLARGACMRFIASRAYDWINTPADALVRRKDPLEFVRRLRFYREYGENIFTAAFGNANA